MSGKIEVKISGDASQFQSALSKAKSAADGFKRSVVTSAAASVAGFMSIDYAVSKLTEIVKEYGDIADISAKTGASIAEVQRLGYVFSQSGSNAETAARAIGKFRQAMVDGAKTGGDARTVLLALGYSINDIKSGNIDAMDAFYKTADAVKYAASDVDALRIANAMFGEKLAGEVIPVLQSGGEEMRKMGGEINVVSDESVQKLDALGDAFSRMSLTLKNSLAESTPYLLKFGAVMKSALVQQINGLATAGETAAKVWQALNAPTDPKASLGQVFSTKFSNMYGAVKEGLGMYVDTTRENLAELKADLFDEGAAEKAGAAAVNGAERARNKAVFTDAKEVAKAEAAVRDKVNPLATRQAMPNDADQLARVGLYAGGGAVGYQRTIADATMRTANAVERIADNQNKTTATFSKV